MKQKLKTNKSVSKRFKKTATGKFLRNKSKARHLMISKSPKSKRAYRLKAVISKGDSKRLSALLPYA